MPAITRQNIDLLAWHVRQAHEAVSLLPLESDHRWAADHTWDRTAIEVANAIEFGNVRFDRKRFFRACGYTHRSDGSMYPVSWSAGIPQRLIVQKGY